MDGTILVADDDRTIRTVLTQALTRAGCKVHATSSLMTLLRWIEEGKGDVVITDVMMPDGNGLETIPEIQAKQPDLPVIVISAQNTIATAIQAAEVQAYDYMPKPFDLPDLMKRVGKALATKRPTRTNPTNDDDPAAALPLIGHTPAMQALYKLVAQVMNSEMSVLLEGASGTGKSLVARTIHQFSDRRNRAITIASATDFLDEDRATSTMARAKDGTLVIEDVADLQSDAQAILAQLLDRQENDGARVIATTQVDLGQLTLNGDFRQDLYFRITGVTIKVPRLQDRIDDIEPLANAVLARLEQNGGRSLALTPNAVSALQLYSWPGNVRQLEHVVQQAALVATGAEIGKPDVENVLIRQPQSEPIKFDGPDDKISASIERHLRRYFDLMGGNLPPPGLYGRILREVEVPLIGIALDATSGNQAKCADLLGINRNTLRKKLNDLDIRVTRGRKLM